MSRCGTPRGRPRVGTRGTVQIVVLSMGIGLLSSCFGGRGTPSLSLPGGGVEGWEIRTTEYIALWYHSLAFPTAVVPPAERPAVPRFAPEYTDEIEQITDRKSTRLNSSHVAISYAVFCLK